MAECPPDSTADWPEFEHAHERTIVLPGYRVVFVPVPKGGCTSVLWLLADLAGYEDERFMASVSGQVSPVMTIHDLTLWQDRFRWSRLSEQRRDEITGDDGWLRFTTVRDPASRLWSAWQSKLLLREPGYVARFGDAPWFPQQPQRPVEVMHAFRAFVRALAGDLDERPVDVHWAPQKRILETAPALNFIGRLESMPDAVGRLRRHMGNNRWNSGRLRRENRSLLPYNPAVFDDETAEIVNTVYADDFEAYGYTPLPRTARGDIGTWVSEARQVVPVIGALVERHERIAALHREAARAGKNRRPRKRNVNEARPRADGDVPGVAEHNVIRPVLADSHQETP